MPEKEILAALSEVRGQMDSLNKHLNDNTENIGDLRRQIITKDHLRKRRHQVILIASLLVIVGLVAEHGVTTKCFLTPAQTGWSEKTCATLYPGYDKAVNQSKANLAKFQGLIAQVPANQARIASLESQVHALDQRAGIPSQ